VPNIHLESKIRDLLHHLQAVLKMKKTIVGRRLIKEMGINGATADGDHAIPMVATRDIAAVAAKYLAGQDLKGKNVLPILGERDYSFNELTRIIGKAIGKPDLQYVQFPVEQAKRATVAQGLSSDIADDITQMETSLKNGIMNYEPRMSANSSPTSAESFVDDIFVPLYRSL